MNFIDDQDQSMDEDQEITGINITPLVDVMLVLLVIFMVTASYIVNASVKINLPEMSEASLGESDGENRAVLLIDSNSDVYFEGQKLEKETISEFVKSKDIRSVIISADKSVPHGDVIDLMNRVKKAGVAEFSVDVQVVK